MIAVDTSAVVAILLGEPEAERLARVIEGGGGAISAGSLTETLRVMMAGGAQLPFPTCGRS